MQYLSRCQIKSSFGGSAKLRFKMRYMFCILGQKYLCHKNFPVLKNILADIVYLGSQRISVFPKRILVPKNKFCFRRKNWFPYRNLVHKKSMPLKIFGWPKDFESKKI